jgi:hypothetical protein
MVVYIRDITGDIAHENHLLVSRAGRRDCLLRADKEPIAATRSSTTQVTVQRRLSDDAQAGIGGDAHIGESKHQGLALTSAHGHVDQATSSAVMSRPYR